MIKARALGIGMTKMKSCGNWRNSFHYISISSVKRIYYKMPSALKSCLSYLSIFPKGYDIRMENVITQWAALGILGSTHGSLPVYAQGRKYIQELLSVFFLEAPDKSTVSKGYDIRMENVITQWAALGILGSTHGSLPVYAQGRKYIQELLSVFFLEAPDKSTVSDYSLLEFV
jgi:hypothetical protein